MRLICASLAGGLFGAGLWLSGMTDTLKIQNWLDLFGAWDPSLMFVMGAAILPMAVAWRFAAGRKPLLGGDFPAPAAPRFDWPLIGGSILFGMGWALSGLCPGPAVASVSWGGLGGAIFLLSMVGGMWLAPWLRTRLDGAARRV